MRHWSELSTLSNLHSLMILRSTISLGIHIHLRSINGHNSTWSKLRNKISHWNNETNCAVFVLGFEIMTWEGLWDGMTSLIEWLHVPSTHKQNLVEQKRLQGNTPNLPINLIANSKICFETHHFKVTVISSLSAFYLFHLIPSTLKLLHAHL